MDDDVKEVQFPMVVITVTYQQGADMESVKTEIQELLNGLSAKDGVVSVEGYLFGAKYSRPADHLLS